MIPLFWDIIFSLTHILIVLLVVILLTNDPLNLTFCESLGLNDSNNVILFILDIPEFNSNLVDILLLADKLYINFIKFISVVLL